MDQRVQVVAVIAAFALAILILELVRRRRLNERYALLWLFSASIILVLAVWEGLLARVASLLGIAYPPNALFLIAVGFILLLLLSMSTALSRLQGQTRILAQRLAILEARFREAENGSDRHGPEAAERSVDEHDRTTG